MLKVAYGECTVSQKSFYKWYKLFTEGREEVNDDARPGRPSTSTSNENTEAVKKIVMENRRITCYILRFCAPITTRREYPRVMDR